MKTEKMNELLQKYVENKLSATDFEELQKLINSSSDKELETQLQELWMATKNEPMDESILQKIKADIDSRLQRKHWIKRYSLKKISRIAAIVTIPLFAGMMLYLVAQLPSSQNKDMVVSVDAGEKVKIVLPDGSKVNLNSETTLSYNPNDFNRRYRDVSLQGEAYFQVEKNKQIPFRIQTTHMKVEVLGTTFNLLAREENEQVELELVEGRVQINSSFSNDEIILLANQKAILDKKSGKIEVQQLIKEKAAPWRRDEMIFQGTPIHKVFREIERNYGVKIEVDYQNNSYNDMFTGTFAIRNLKETLDLLRLHYHYEYNIEGKTVKIRNFKPQ